MANPEHVKILKQGVEVWNRWREENPDLRPDLSEANLSGAKLNLANLNGAHLRKAYLRKADLRGLTSERRILVRRVSYVRACMGPISQNRPSLSSYLINI